MRIEEVESLVAGTAHFVRVHSDTGHSGLGQSACWAYPGAVDAVVRTFREYLVGKDPNRIEHHWHQMYRMGPFRGSILGAAVSAVDIALWDLKGKHLSVPVWELLGGRYRDRLRLHLLVGGDVVAGARQAAEMGFTAVKFNPLSRDHFDLPLAKVIDEAVSLVAAVRESVGADVDLILELHRSLTPLHALPLVTAMQRFHPLFYEDPIQIDSVTSQADLSRRTSLPAAHGERLHTIWEFRELLEQAGSQYVRADPGLAGGISHGKKIAAVAEAHHSAVVWHNWLGPVLTAACVQLDASIPNFVTQEYHLVADEGELSAGFTSGVERVGGELLVPESPGLGVELDETRLGSLDQLGRPLWRIPQRSDGTVAFAV